MWVKEGSDAKRDGLTASRGSYFYTDGGVGVPKMALKVVGQWND